MGGLFSVDEGKIRNQLPDANVANYNGEVALSTSWDIIDENGFGIGFIQNLSPTDSRPATKIRHISSKDGGIPIEHAPGVDDMTLSITGFTLYNRQEDGSVVQRLGGAKTLRAMKMLAEQKMGFSIVERCVDPKTGEVVDATLYQDCWMTNHGKPIAITTPTISETVTISCRGGIRPLNYKQL